VLAVDPGTSHTAEELERIQANRQRYESQLQTVTRRWGAKVHAYCWLPDAALMLIEVAYTPLEDILHTLRGSFSHYLHREAGLSQRPYQGRYAALLVEPDEFLIDCTRHIVCQPVEKGLCKNAWTYEHSSLHAWVKAAPVPEFLASSAVPQALEALGIHLPSGLRRFLLARHVPGFDTLLRRGSREDSRVMGRAPFVREAHRAAQRTRRITSPELVTRWVSQFVTIEPDPPHNSERSAPGLIPALSAWLITSSGTASLSEVARWFHVNKATLHKRIERYSQTRSTLFSQHTLAQFLTFLAEVDLEERHDAPNSVDSEPADA